jgi:hypothetical protein
MAGKRFIIPVAIATIRASEPMSTEVLLFTYPVGFLGQFEAVSIVDDQTR